MNDTVILKVYGNDTMRQIRIGLTSIQSGHTINMIEDVLGMRYASVTNTNRGKKFSDNGLFEDVEKHEDGRLIIDFDDGISQVTITPQYLDNSVKFDFKTDDEVKLLAIRETVLNFFNTEFGKA